jgi:hypothetical protein
MKWKHEPDGGLMWRVGLASKLARLFPGLGLVVIVEGDRVRLKARERHAGS